VRTDEQHRLSRDPPSRHQRGQRVTMEVHVPTTSVTTRTAARDQTDRLQHIEVVGEQIRSGAGELTQFERRTIRTNELVDDRQADRIAQGRMASGSEIVARCHLHTLIIWVNIY
jgi:hypothetical protein